MGAVRTSHPRFRREGGAPNVVLTDDDVEIIKFTYRHRFIRADDLYRLYDNRSPDRLSRRLTLLYRAGYLDRPIAQIDRYGQGGSQSMVYGLDNAGARYLKETQGVSIGGANWRSRNRAYGRQNLEHTLAVSKFLVDLEIEVRAIPNVSLISFDEILAAAPEKTRYSPNPLCWSVPVQWRGGKADVQLAPDAMFGLRVKTESGKTRRAYFFVEVDRGSMTIEPSAAFIDSDAFLYRSTIFRKMFAYASSFHFDLHLKRFQIHMVRVLFFVNSPARALSVTRAIEKASRIEAKVLANTFLVLSAATDGRRLWNSIL